MQPVLRQLVPAPPGGPPDNPDVEPRKRKKKARLACNHCRLKRVGCDGARPECTRCQRSRVPCIYLSDDADATPTMALKSEIESLQRQLRECRHLLADIRATPYHHAMTLVDRIRSEDLSALLASYHPRTGEPSHTSDPASARAALATTETEGGLVELAMLHPTTHPLLTTPSPSAATSPSQIRGSTRTTSSSGTPLSPDQPYPCFDSRLQVLSVSYWTQIPIDNGLAARALSHFLQTDHPVLNFLDADLFIRDLVGHCLHFCSSFLFHAVMSLACQSYSTVDLRVSPFIFAFTEEALKLWHADRLVDSVPTLAALNCLSVAVSWNGDGDLGHQQLAADARAMAARMQLMDVHAPVEPIPDLDDDHGNLAWGSCGWQS